MLQVMLHDAGAVEHALLAQEVALVLAHTLLLPQEVALPLALAGLPATLASRCDPRFWQDCL
jgi:hypothetical protein